MLDPSPSVNPVERFSPAEQALIARLLREQVHQARHDPAAFITTCAREEHGSQRPIRLAAHQKLLLEFAQRYQMSVVRMPVGSSKTFLLTYLGLWNLGRDRTSRGAIVGAAASQSYKPLAFIRRQIESGDLAVVFPELEQSSDPHDAWARDQITVERPGNIRDPSIRALGIDGKIQGARISWVLADDVLDGENTATNESRDKIDGDFEANILSRLDRLTGRCCVTNTPWDRDDLTFRLSERGWPLIGMNVDGDVWFDNVDDPMGAFGQLIRPSRKHPGRYRLRSSDPDPEEIATLWPEEMPREWVEIKRGTIRKPGLEAMTPFNFARFMMCDPFDAGSARCLRTWVDKAFELGQGMAFPAERSKACPTFTGVDIGGTDKHHDESSILTFELQGDGRRKILNLQTGHWTGKELISRIIDEARMYDPVIYVESNGAQKFLAEFAQAADLNARIRKFDTGKNKYDESFGVEAVFTEMANDQWIWPDGGSEPASPLLERLGRDCVYYDPAKHTPDQLMALFLARQGLTRYRSKAASKGKVGSARLSFTGGGF